MNSILITGAHGFIGQCLTRQLATKKYKLRLASRYEQALDNSQLNKQNVLLNLEEINLNSGSIVKNIDTVIHLAGITHSESVNKKKLYEVSAEGVARLAELSMLHGVKLFIFLSTAKVHGKVKPNQMVTENTPLVPQDDYANSKLQGEKALVDVCKKGEMQFVILRPPLVYGPGVKANFLKLLSLVDKRYPLPFAKFNNLRSYIYVENLCHIIEGIIHRETCRNQAYLVKDCDLSTYDLIVQISEAFGAPPNILNLPVKLLESIARIINKKDYFDRLYNSYVIDNSKLINDLGWVSSVDLTTAMSNTVDWYNKSYKDRS